MCEIIGIKLQSPSSELQIADLDEFWMLTTRFQYNKSHIDIKLMINTTSTFLSTNILALI